MAIIGISGKSRSGKDLVGKIIQYLTTTGGNKDSEIPSFRDTVDYQSDWIIHKFANPLKDIVCILTGCTREQLEDNKFKNSKLPDEWIRYGFVQGFYKYYNGGCVEETIMNNVQCDKERYDLELKVNWQTAYKGHLTYRELLQYLGTDLVRNKLHENAWINATFSKHKPEYKYNDNSKATVDSWHHTSLPNWIITDCRFENEAKAIKDRDGLLIRVNRGIYPNDPINIGVHESETSLDNYQFDHTINNNGTIDELIEKVKQILIKEKII